MPTYTPISGALVKDRNGKYTTAKQQHTTATGTEKSRLAGLMKLYSDEVKDELDEAMKTLTANFKAHQDNIEAMVKTAAEDVKYAKQIAAQYKKKARPEFPGQMKHLVAKTAKAEVDAKADALAFGNAWKDYRENVAKDFPAEVIAAAEVIRKDVINKSKITAAKITALKAAAEETAALSTVMDKATRKQVTKVKRPLTDAKKAANDLALQMEALKVEAQTPPGRGTQPNSIRSGATTIASDSVNKDLTKTPALLSDNEGRWATVEASWKGLNVRAANMAKVLEASKKGFHSDELKDPVVKAEFIKAITSLKTIQTDVKNYAKDYAKAKAAIAKVRERFAAAKKKK